MKWILPHETNMLQWSEADQKLIDHNRDFFRNLN